MSTIRTSQTRQKWKDMLVRSIEIILGHVTGKEKVDPDALAGLIYSLPIELSQWKRDLSKQEKKEVLLPLIELLDPNTLVEPVREGISLVLAVLAMSVNDYPDLHTFEDVRQWEHEYRSYPSLVATHLEAAVTWDRDPSSHNSVGFAQHDSENRAGWRAWRAQQAARIYTIHPDLRKKYAESLLLVGLAGLLNSFAALGLEDQSSRIVPVIARQLGRMSILNRSQIVGFPLVPPLAFDIRAYAVDRVIQTLRPPRYSSQLNRLSDSAKAELLEAFSEKHRLWIDFGSQLVLPIIQALHLTSDPQLQKQCLIAMDEYSLTDPSPLEWQLFSSYEIPKKLVTIVKSDPHLRSRAVSNFESFTQQLHSKTDEGELLFSAPDILRSLILGDLFETLVIDIVCRAGSKHMSVWKTAIIELPNILKSHAPAHEADAMCLNVLHQFCRPRPFKTDVNLLVVQLKDELVSRVLEISIHNTLFTHYLLPRTKSNLARLCSV
jgi:hypothetical protein